MGFQNGLDGEKPSDQIVMESDTLNEAFFPLFYYVSRTPTGKSGYRIGSAGDTGVLENDSASGGAVKEKR